MSEKDKKSKQQSQKPQKPNPYPKDKGDDVNRSYRKGK